MGWMMLQCLSRLRLDGMQLPLHLVFPHLTEVKQAPVLPIKHWNKLLYVIATKEFTIGFHHIRHPPGLLNISAKCNNCLFVVFPDFKLVGCSYMLKAHVGNIKVNSWHAYSNHPKKNNKAQGGEGWTNLGKNQDTNTFFCNNTGKHPARMSSFIWGSQDIAIGLLLSVSWQSHYKMPDLQNPCQVQRTNYNCVQINKVFKTQEY